MCNEKPKFDKSCDRATRLCGRFNKICGQSYNSSTYNYCSTDEVLFPLSIYEILWEGANIESRGD